MKNRHALAMMSTVCALLLASCGVTLPRMDPKTLRPEQKETLASLQKLDDWPLYSMTYTADYRPLLEFKRKYYRVLGMERPECSTFAAMGGDSRILARNSDDTERPALLLFTRPPDGYASVSMAYISEVYGSTDLFDSPDTATTLLLSPYCISDGMNSQGLAVGEMSVPGSKSAQDPAKSTMFESEALRYLLDHAKDTEEAVTILSEHNVSFPMVGQPGHLLVADASGRSAVIEWSKGEMKVTRNDQPWQVATNFLLFGSEELIRQGKTELDGSGAITHDLNGKSLWRYLTAWEALRRAGGRLSASQAMDVLASISLERSKEIWYPTNWSIVYDLRSRSVDIAMGRNYATVYHFDPEASR